MGAVGALARRAVLACRRRPPQRSQAVVVGWTGVGSDRLRGKPWQRASPQPIALLRLITKGFRVRHRTEPPSTGRPPHRRRQLRPPRPDHPAADLSRERIKRRPVLGGLLSEYERAA